MWLTLSMMIDSSTNSTIGLRDWHRSHQLTNWDQFHLYVFLSEYRLIFGAKRCSLFRIVSALNCKPGAKNISPNPPGSSRVTCNQRPKHNISQKLVGSWKGCRCATTALAATSAAKAVVAQLSSFWSGEVWSEEQLGALSIISVFSEKTPLYLLSQT